MRMVDLILKKREGEALSKAEIDFIINGFTKGEIPDYQMSAFMMAVCFRGMTSRETADLTLAMMNSGRVLDLSDIPGVKLDKHSTGGVGDTTTLVIAPIVAACGGTVAKMSGRGLGHTGGTLDKLESVKGVSVDQSVDRFKEIVKEIGLCVIGQTEGLTPADKLMYALRDVTGTVESIPLIASSIMSKKLAVGTDAIVLDVKVGSGAFMRTVDMAKELAKTMVEIGEHVGKKVVAMITDMNQPLGLAVGNGLEMREAIDVLSGRVKETDLLFEVCMGLSATMLLLAGIAKDEEDGKARARAAIKSGAALEKLRLMLQMLGGDTACIRDPDILVQVKRKIPVCLGRNGYISDMRASDIGVAAQLLGAGRATKADKIDPAVGLVMHKRYGDSIAADEPFATLYVNDERRLDEAIALLKSAVSIRESINQEFIYRIGLN